MVLSVRVKSESERTWSAPATFDILHFELPNTSSKEGKLNGNRAFAHWLTGHMNDPASFLSVTKNYVSKINSIMSIITLPLKRHHIARMKRSVIAPRRPCETRKVKVGGKISFG